MRILMLNYEFPPLGGGGGIAAKKIAEGFIEKGYEVDYVTSHHPELKRYEEVDGIKVHRVPVGRKKKDTASVKSMLAYPVSGLPKCIELCSKYDYDFINTHFAVPSGPLGVIISKLFGIKHILSIHGGDIYDPTKETSPHRNGYLRKAVEFSINNSDRVVAQSTNTKKNANKYYEIDKDIQVIPLPYEPYDFEEVSREELGLEEDKTYLISVGRLIKRKGYRYLIEAVSMIEDKDVEALIIGSGPLKQNLEKKAKDLGVKDRLHLLGYVPEEKKFQYLDNSDIYVLSSIHEGFGIVLQEAMQVGLPIIATSRGGHTEYLEGVSTVYFVKEKRFRSLSSKIKEIIEHSNRLDKNNIKNHIKEFERSKILQNYLRKHEGNTN